MYKQEGTISDCEENMLYEPNQKWLLVLLPVLIRKTLYQMEI